MDAMSDAIEHAEVMLYGVSMAYKESANCRLEANYAHQQELDMIPLMMQENYSANGWLGLLLGTRLWYSFWEFCKDAAGDDTAAFQTRMDTVAKEIGERGKPRPVLPESVPPMLIPSVASLPAPTPAAAQIPSAQAPAPVRAPAPMPAPMRALSTAASHVPDDEHVLPSEQPKHDPFIQVKLLLRFVQVELGLGNLCRQNRSKNRSKPDRGLGRGEGPWAACRLALSRV